MSRRFEPLLSSKLFDDRPEFFAANVAKLRFPLLGSPKYDGWRLFEFGGKPTTRSLIPPKNYSAVRRMSEMYAAAADLGIRGLDGEGIVGSITSPNAMQATTSGLGSYAGEPDITYLIFDSYQRSQAPYQEREQEIREKLDDSFWSEFGWARMVDQTTLHNWEDALAYEAGCVSAGLEGIMLRKPDAHYKMGRSTLNDGIILTALKRFVDDEAEILEVREQLRNDNPAEEDAYGRTKRSSHQENLVGKGSMGSVLCRSRKFDETFSVGYGKGLNDALRAWLWEHRSEIPGRMLTYSYQETGCVDRPRHPRWKALRAREDMGS